MSEEPEHVKIWTDRWVGYQEKGITPGFHRPHVHESLVAHAEQFLKKEKGDHRIFVPLCGKTLDMLFLSEIGEVAGVEVSPLAIEEFQQENGLSIDADLVSQSQQRLFRFAPSKPGANTVTLGRFDVFNLPSNWSQGSAERFTAAYDRASFIAIDPKLRGDYATVMKEQLLSGAKVLLLTLEYDTSKGSGPPYSTSEADVRAAFEPAGFTVDMLKAINIIDAPNNQSWKDKGHVFLNENVFILSKI